MTDHETSLRDAFRKIDARRAQAIREAYYKAVEGLQALAEALEVADSEAGEKEHRVWLDEHLLACQAQDAMRQSVLGRIL